MLRPQRKQSPKSTDDFVVLTTSNLSFLDSSEVDFISAPHDLEFLFHCRVVFQ